MEGDACGLYALRFALVVFEWHLGDLEVVELRLQIDAFRGRHGAAGFQRFFVGLLQAFARVESEQGHIVHAVNLFLCSAHAFRQGWIGVSIGAVQIFDGDEVGNGVVDGVQKIALLFQLLGQGAEPFGRVFVFSGRQIGRASCRERV